MKKIFLTIIIIFSLLLVVACGENNDTGPTLTLEELEYDPNGLPIVNETVDFKIIAPKNALADNYNDMTIFKKLNSETNVNVNFENLSEQSYSATKNLILTDTSSLPDAIYHAGFSDRDIIQYSNANILLPLNEYLDSMPRLEKILEDRPDIKKIITAPDGNIYSLPRVEEMGLLEHPNILFINKTWVNKLSSENKLSFSVQITKGNLLKDDNGEYLNVNPTVIKINDEVVNGFTLSQYEEILEAIKNNRSLLTSADNIIPLSYIHDHWQGNQSDLFSSFGIPDNIDHRLVIDNEVVITATDNKFKDAINYLADWFDRGLIEKDVFTQGELEFLAKGKGNHPRLGSFYWWEKETVIKTEWQDDYVPIPPLIGLNGTQTVGLANNYEINKGYFVVFKKTKLPEVLLSWIDRFYDPIISAQINYGPIGLVFEEELNENGMLVNKPIPDGVTADELRLKNAPLGVIYLTKNEWENNVLMEYRARLRLNLLDVYVKPYVPSNISNYPNVSYNLSEINQVNRLGRDIDDYINRQIPTWLLNKGVSDSEWNSYLSQLNRLDINSLINVYQSAYDRLKDSE